MDAERRKRINMYKKIIITVVLMSILIPLVFCVVLLLQVCSLKREVERLNAFQSSCYEDLQNYGVEINEKQTLPEETPYVDEIIVSEESISVSKESEELNSSGKSQSSVVETPPVVTEESTTEQRQETFVEETTTTDTRKKVYLTFDDGPSSNTNAILDILKEYNAKATFFVNGKNSELFGDEYRRIVEEGHTLAMHSYTHQYDDVYSSVEAFMEDMHRLRDYIYELTGVTCDIYRFPGGSSNTITKIDIREFGRALAEEDIVYFDWNVSSGDAVYPAKRAEEIYAAVTEGVIKKSTPVVLMHDMKSKATTVESLPMILEFLVENDYNIAALDSSVEPVQHRKID